MERVSGVLAPKQGHDLGLLPLGGVETVVLPPGASPGRTFGYTGHSTVGLSVWDVVPEMSGAGAPPFSLL